jgi:AraC-like DNA-binding protein
MAGAAVDLDRLTVHLAHRRADVPGMAGSPPRTHTDWMLLLPLDAHAWRCPLGVRASDGPALYLIPPGMPFAIDSRRYRHYSAHFSAASYVGWRETSSRQRVASDALWPRSPMTANPQTLRLQGASWRLVSPEAGRADLLAAFDRLVAAYQSGDRFRSVVALLQLLERCAAAPGRDDGSRLRRFADHLAFRGHQDVSVGALAQDCGMSRMHLHRLCLRVYGVPPKELLLRERLAIACRALERGAAVGAAAEAAGFLDPYYFSRLFTRRQGIPPSRWAARARA